MNLFEKIIQNQKLKCDICGSVMLVMYGGGWDNDRLMCSERESCGVEIEFPTTTIYQSHTEEKCTRLEGDEMSKQLQEDIDQLDKIIARHESDIKDIERELKSYKNRVKTLTIEDLKRRKHETDNNV